MAKRRVKGEGSVYRRGDGRVVGEYEDANGKRRYVSGKTKAEVRRKLCELLADRDEGIAYDSENLTLGAYLARWLLAAKGTVRQRTWDRHEQVVRLHLGPTLGNVRLDRLTALQVQALYGRKLEEGLSPRTVEIVHATLHKALKQAVGWTLIPRNAAEGATPPRSVGKEVRPLSLEQARTLLDAARGDALELVGQEGCIALLRRHAGGDWGELNGHDRQANERALRGGARLLSSYPVGDGKVWIITEADRSSTCVLLPSEY